MKTIAIITTIFTVIIVIWLSTLTFLYLNTKVENPEDYYAFLIASTILSTLYAGLGITLNMLVWGIDYLMYGFKPKK